MAGSNERPRRRRVAPDDAVGPFYIPSISQQRTEGARILKDGDTFAVFDAWGDMQASGPAAEGLFHEDMRYLSSLALLFEGERPLLLSSRVTGDNGMLAIDLANPDLFRRDRIVLARDTVHILRCIVLDEGACFECLEIKSFAEHPVAFTLNYRFD
ncbi:MAG TPA: glycogen debranching N-terminal domain-containing protein, partial [Stellaceae bacterium]|nr:glycogen debranching N-terminal domain-containing protein [Stellaceae bacterium]